MQSSLTILSTFLTIAYKFFVARKLKLCSIDTRKQAGFEGIFSNPIPARRSWRAFPAISQTHGLHKFRTALQHLLIPGVQSGIKLLSHRHINRICTAKAVLNGYLCRAKGKGVIQRKLCHNWKIPYQRYQSL